MQYKKPQVWAHRGASGWDKQYAPENTMPAFAKAVAMGADGVELDVQLTKDGEIVVVHDESIDRVSNGTGLVKDHTLAELKELSFSKTHPEYGFIGIPTLEEFFSFMKTNDLAINIELKTSVIRYEGLEEKTAELARKMDMGERILYSSFNHYSVRKMQVLAPESRTGILFADAFIDVAAYAKQHGFTALHPARYLLDYPGFIEECHREGRLLHVWTVDSRIDMQSICQSGVDAFITDCPDNGRKIADGVELS